MLPKKEIASVAKLFTKGLLAKRSPKDMCFIVSTALVGYLNYLGVKSHLQEGYVFKYHHYWIDLENDYIIDATANQFTNNKGVFLNNIWASKKPKYYRAI